MSFFSCLYIWHQEKSLLLPFGSPLALSVLCDIYVKMLHQLLLLPRNRIFSFHKDNPGLCEKGEKEETHTIFNIFPFLPHPPLREKKPLKHAYTESGKK